MKRIILLSCLYLAFFSTLPVSAQSNDEKAIYYNNDRLQSLFIILRTESQHISTTCLESLKKLHAFKEEMVNSSSSPEKKEINAAILRSMMNNSVEFCTIDAQTICRHELNDSARAECRKLPR